VSEFAKGGRRKDGWKDGWDWREEPTQPSTGIVLESLASLLFDK